MATFTAFCVELQQKYVEEEEAEMPNRKSHMRRFEVESRRLTTSIILATLDTFFLQELAKVKLRKTYFRFLLDYQFYFVLGSSLYVMM